MEQKTGVVALIDTEGKRGVVTPDDGGQELDFPLNTVYIEGGTKVAPPLFVGQKVTFYKITLPNKRVQATSVYAKMD